MKQIAFLLMLVATSCCLVPSTAYGDDCQSGGGVVDNGLLVGTSRKSMIGKLLDNQPSERLAGTIATTVLGYERGGHIFRVHDVAPNRDALRVAEATLYAPPENR